MIRFHHVSIIVANTAQSLEFYVELLGMQVSACRPDLGYPGAWLELGNAQIHLLELPNPDPLDNRPEHGGRDRHLAIEVDNYNELKQKLSANGIAFSTSRSGRQALFCRDPDQNAVEIIAVQS